MTDIFTSAKRSEIMSRIKGRDTKPERAVRSLLHHMGYRFRLNRTDLPGRPDIVLSRYKSVVLVHGCFWHRHEGCRFAYIPKSRIDFWHVKFESNINRDNKVKADLEQLGWRVIIVWECELRQTDELCSRLDATLRGLVRLAEE
ncbi:DNA mismatch endonuclease Vsr [Geobacter sp. FeAm09]|uniref:very short patch repair endonuclease n=1 Tax=Geobacter sp. FeAm09 TaxID=2597769 RepID=UPI0011F052A0|nr:DNA mismatch endonuclease Vsr [Geobacter sp. FeAm09]QEM67413.1 DNA mismatch endonuclease Vsr [Geobacter sp. FeAm09]